MLSACFYLETLFCYSEKISDNLYELTLLGLSHNRCMHKG